MHNESVPVCTSLQPFILSNFRFVFFLFRCYFYCWNSFLFPSSHHSMDGANEHKSINILITLNRFSSKMQNRPQAKFDTFFCFSKRKKKKKTNFAPLFWFSLWLFKAFMEYFSVSSTFCFYILLFICLEREKLCCAIS